MSRVPLVDVRAHDRELRAELDAALARVLDSGRYALGPAVEEFESAFADQLGSAHCVGVNSGTSALHLALLACGVGPGDEVVTTPYTWISTCWAISYLGATPVFADLEPDTLNLDPKRAADAIGPRTRAVLPVHLFGQAADVGAFTALCRERGAALVEDAAQAHGARVAGRAVGSFGRAGIFSFYPTKNLGALGEAGCVVTDDADVAARIRALRDHAQQRPHVHAELGWNARMEALQAAALAVKLPRLDAWNDARRRVAKRLLSELSGVPGISLPGCRDEAAHVWHVFAVRVDGDRDGFRAFLDERGIDTAVHYPTPAHLQPAYAGLGHRAGSFPVAEDAAQRSVSLPMSPYLSETQIDRVVDAVRAWSRRG